MLIRGEGEWPRSYWITASFQHTNTQGVCRSSLIIYLWRNAAWNYWKWSRWISPLVRINPPTALRGEMLHSQRGLIWHIKSTTNVLIGRSVYFSLFLLCVCVFFFSAREKNVRVKVTSDRNLKVWLLCSFSTGINIYNPMNKKKQKTSRHKQRGFRFFHDLSWQKPLLSTVWKENTYRFGLIGKRRSGAAAQWLILLLHSTKVWPEAFLCWLSMFCMCLACGESLCVLSPTHESQWWLSSACEGKCECIWMYWPCDRVVTCPRWIHPLSSTTKEGVMDGWEAQRFIRKVCCLNHLRWSWFSVFNLLMEI